MTLPIHQRYEIIFLFQHPLSPKLRHKFVPKTVKCSTSTVQHWLNRWKESTNLNDSDRTDRARAATPKQDQQIASIDEQQIFVTSRDITTENESRLKRERCDEAEAKYSRPLSKPLLTENHRMNRLKWTKDHKAMN